MSETASASVSSIELDPSTFQYSLILTNTSSTTATIGTFWFAWVPGKDFLATSPTDISSPTGWAEVVTHAGSGDGFAIQWKASSPAADLAQGGTLTGFGFDSTDTPTAVLGNSVFFPGTPVTTSTIYSGTPFSDGGFQFVATSTACFAAGTRILAARGEIAVERLAAGDLVPTLLGEGLARVRWIGHRRVDCRRHPRKRDVWPIRVRRGAFGPGLPIRDLLLSPDHAVHIDAESGLPARLIPIRYLVNGATVAQEKVAEVSYFHVELDRHDVLWAERLPAESYLDTGNRAAFDNAGEVVMAHPDFALRVWETGSCLPLAVEGPVLTAARARLLRRAAELGYGSTADPDLRLLVDGATVAAETDGNLYRFHLPKGAREARLLSRSAVPAEFWADSGDHRRLGVAVARLALDGAAAARAGRGWHAPEPGLQWTDGDAAIVCAGARCLDVELLPLPRYWDEVAQAGLGSVAAAAPIAAARTVAIGLGGG